MEYSFEKNEEFRSPEKNKGTPLAKFLLELDQAGLPPLPEDEIRQALDEVKVAIATLEGDCGVRISRKNKCSGDGKRIKNSFEGRSWTTNEYENPKNPVYKQFAHRKILLD